VIGLLNILELARRQQAKVLQASTSEIYGEPEIHPQGESYCLEFVAVMMRERVGKKRYFLIMHANMKVKIARIFNTYGPRMNPNNGRVSSNFIVQSLENKALTMYGNGEQTRSFSYVDDLVDGIMAIMNSEDESRDQ